MGKLVAEPLVLTRLKELRLIHLHLIKEATVEANSIQDFALDR
jgi:hypothetical protein